jgi:hypothetical protein
LRRGPPKSSSLKNGIVAQTLLSRDADTAKHYDIIVVGSAMGDGVVASALADARKKVSILEAGSPAIYV